MTIQLSVGPISYVDTGGAGGVIVFLHGLLMDATLWNEVISDLGKDFRCIAPTLPLGAHTTPMPETADLSLSSIAMLVHEFLDHLNLTDNITLVGNDTGGALVQLIVAQSKTENRRRAPMRICLISCDAFDNFPPGLTGKTIVAIGKLPPALFGLFMQQMRLRPMRRLPIAFGWLTKRGDTATKRWIKPLLQSKHIRRNTVDVLRAMSKDKTLLIEAAKRLPQYSGKALIVWAQNDRVMPPDHGRRLADLFQDSEFIEISDSRTLVPLDQPAPLATAIRSFLDRS
jgi:pimeloyl-ACP methyl ester carboxylesterase